MAAEEQNLIKVEASIGNLALFETDVREAISSDLFSALGQEWNKERNKIIDLVMGPLLFPAIVKGLKEKLSADATTYVISEATKNLETEIEMAGWAMRGPMKRDNTPILAMSWGDGERGSPLIGVLLDVFGNFVDRVSFDRMHDSATKQSDLDRMLEYLQMHSVELIVMSGTAPNTKTRLWEDVKRVVEDGRMNIEVMILDDAVAKIYMDSKRGIKEVPNSDATWGIVRYCISLGRRAIDPTMEFAGLFNSDNDILLLHLHPLQSLVCFDFLCVRFLMKNSSSLLNEVSAIS
jgi:transcriptional accessory protein Tex/SPT6